MKHIAILTIFTTLISASFAQNNAGSIEGYIYDDNEQPLIGITVKLKNFETGTITNSVGQFILKNVPTGSQTIRITGVGFEALEREVVVEAGQATYINFVLKEGIISLSEVVVLGNYPAQYYQPLTSANKMSQRLQSVPKSIQVVPAKVVSDQQNILLHDAVINVSGVSKRSTTNDFTMRGYNNGGGSSAGSITFINGMRNQFTPYENELVLFNIDRIEFIKGPASVLYGTNQPGGMINVVTKKPQAETAANLSLAAGSWGRYRLETDLTGALSKDNKWLYRLNGAIYKSPDYRDFFYNNTFGIAPSLSFIPNNKTQFHLEVMYTSTNRLTWYDWGIPAINGDLDALPLEYTPHEPTDFVDWESSAVFGDFSHKLTDNLTVRSSFMGSGNNNNGEVHAPDFFAPAPNASGDVTRNFRKIRYNNSSFFLTNYLDLRFETGSIKHNLVVGFDVFDSKRSGDIQQAGTAEGVSVINVFDPQYRQASVGSYDLSGGFFSFNRTNYVGGFIQDFIEVGDKLKVMLGLRYEDYTYKSLPSLAPNDSDPFIPNLGIVYAISEDFSVYSTFSQGYIPQNNQSPDRGGPFDPELSEQLEFGAKKELFGGGLSATVSVYQITRKNQLVPDPDDSAIRLTTGETESQGVELDLIGKPTSAIDLVFNYAYNDVEITKSTVADVVGNRLAGAPRHAGNVWARYYFGSDARNGLSAALGIQSRSEVLAGDNTPIPSYTIFNSAVYYKWENTELSVNWQNMLDERYYLGATNQSYLQPGLPSNFMVRISTRL